MDHIATVSRILARVSAQSTSPCGNASKASLRSARVQNLNKSTAPLGRHFSTSCSSLVNATLPSINVHVPGSYFYQQSLRSFGTGILTKDSIETVPMLERQEGILFERVPKEICNEAIIADLLQRQGLPVSEDGVLVMRSRLGKPTGRVVVLSEEHVEQDILRAFPPVTDDLPPTMRLVDKDDVEGFVEQCERYVRLSDDLRWLARPEHLRRVVTLTEVPKTYGRKEVAGLILEHAGVKVDPQNVVFRFMKHGVQADMVWVVAPTEKCANHIIAKIQEVAVAKRVQYGSLFGCSFVFSGRNSLFLSHPSLDFDLCPLDPTLAKYQVFSTGWNSDVGAKEFAALVNQLKLYPVAIRQFYNQHTDTNSFFMRFEQMKVAKKVMRRLHLLQRVWKIPLTDPFYAYPRLADVHWADQDRYADEDSCDDSDIDEPIDY